MPVRLDPRLTATALAHLLENAAQYSPPGSPIDVRASVTDEGLVIAVRDHGPGIAPADLPHLFERFYRGDAARAADLGDRHGPVDRPRTARRRGRPDLGGESPGRRRPVHDRRTGGRQGLGTGRLSNRMTPRPRILLVDDEVAIQRAVGPLLRSRGYDVDIAGTGADALRMVVEQPPDLDRARPGLAGSRRHRGVPADSGSTSEVPIIVLSARGAEADKVNALDLGADDYVTKPFGPEELLARIRVALRRVTSDDRSRDRPCSAPAI